MFTGTCLSSSSASPIQINIPDPKTPDSQSECPSSSPSHHSVPCWATQAQKDLAQAKDDLRQIQVRHASEIEIVKQSVERAILGVHREEQRLLERVQQDQRDTQQHLEQVEKENTAAARVSQSLLEQRFKKLVHFQRRLQTVGQSVPSENGLDKQHLLEEISEFLQPWEISVSLKKVTFKPSSQPNAVSFGDIRVQEQNLCLNIGGCEPHGELCALHSQLMQCEDINHQTSIEEKGIQGQSWTSPTGRVLRKINLLNRSDLNSEEEQKLFSAKIHQWLPKCEQFNCDTSQVDDMDKSCPEPQRENILLAVPLALKNMDIKTKEMVYRMNNVDKYCSPTNQRKRLSVASSKKTSPSAERSKEPTKMSCCSSLDVNGREKGSNGKPLYYGTSTTASPRIPPRGNSVIQSCLDSTSKVRSQSRLSQSSDENSLGTLGDSGRAPSPADSLDSTYTFIVSPSHDFSLNKGSLNHSLHLSKSSVDLTHKTRPLISGGTNKQELCRLKSGNFSSMLSFNSTSPALSRGFRVFDRGQILSYPNYVGNTILPQSMKKAPTTELSKGSVARSLSMSAIDGSPPEKKRGKGEREEHALVKLEEEVDPLFFVVNPSNVHLMAQFGRQGSGRADLTLPSGIHATIQGQLFIVDCGNARIQVTDPQGNVLQQVSSPNISGSSRQCRNYFDIAVNTKGLIALSCAAERALLVFSRHGRLLQTFGGSGLGSAKDELEAPRGVTVTRLDEFLVADIRKGTLIALKLDPKTGSRLERTVVTGFHRPYLVATCLSSGIIAVSERGNETGRVPCIKVLELGWNTVRVLGVCAGMGPVLACPWGICIDKDGNILVADWGEQHRIVLYPAQGIGWSIVNQGLSSPRGLALLPDGQLAVSDSMHHCIKIYNYKG